MYKTMQTNDKWVQTSNWILYSAFTVPGAIAHVVIKCITCQFDAFRANNFIAEYKIVCHILLVILQIPTLSSAIHKKNKLLFLK